MKIGCRTPSVTRPMWTCRPGAYGGHHTRHPLHSERAQGAPMPLHPITFLWVQQQEYERGMTYQEVERAARLAARNRIDSSVREPVLQPVVTTVRPGSLASWIQKLTDTIAQLGHHGPRRASTQAGSTGA